MLGVNWKRINGNPAVASEEYEQMKNEPVLRAIERRERWIIGVLNIVRGSFDKSEEASDAIPVSINSFQ
jgi:hypothetical protein